MSQYDGESADSSPLNGRCSLPVGLEKRLEDRPFLLAVSDDQPAFTRHFKECSKATDSFRKHDLTISLVVVEAFVPPVRPTTFVCAFTRVRHQFCKQRLTVATPKFVRLVSKPLRQRRFF